MGINPLNKVRYAGFDFDTSVDELLARLQVEYGTDFNDFAQSSLGLLLIDLEAYGIDGMSFYLDRRASEVYMSTARTRRAVALLARQLGYKPRSAVASTVDLEIALSQVQAFAVTLPKGHTMSAGGLTYSVAESVTFAAGDGPNDIQVVACYEGQKLSETFVSNGQPNQVFELRRIPEGQFVLQNTFTVVADGAPYTEVDFLEFEKTNQVEIDYLNGIVRFGDGQVGNIPASGTSILVEYVVTSGKNGQIPKDTITALDPLVVLFTNIEFEVTQPDKSLPGDDPESLESIKSNAGRKFKTRSVAVTKEDYESLATAYADPLYGRVAVAKALSTRSASNDLELQANLATITSSGVAAATSILQALAVINSAVTAATTASEEANTSIVNVSEKVTTALSSLETAIGLIRQLRGTALEIDNGTTLIAEAVTAATTAINAYTVAGSTQITSADKTTLLGYVNTIAAQATSIQGFVNQQTTDATSTNANLTVVDDALNEIGEDESTGLIAEILDSISDVDNNLVIISTQGTLIEVAANSDTTAVTDAAQAIQEHVDRILSADCNANLITVPILSRDAAGFYTAPSAGLLASLRNYLEARNDAAHSVEVVSGEPFLIPAVITLRIGIKPGVSPSVISATATNIADSILKNRQFGANLYEGTIGAVLEALPGVVFANVRIEGYQTSSGTSPSKNDTDGNLIIEQTEMITKGSVTVNIEVVEGQEG